MDMNGDAMTRDAVWDGGRVASRMGNVRLEWCQVFLQPKGAIFGVDMGRLIVTNRDFVA